MMKKITWIIGILILSLFLVGCTTQTLPSISDAQEEITKAEIKISEEENEGEEVQLSKDTLVEAKSILVQAKNALEEGNIEEADALAEMSKDLAAESRMKYIGKTLEELE